MLIPHKGHTDTIQVYSVTVMTHVKALQAGHSSQGTSEPITPALKLVGVDDKNNNSCIMFIIFTSPKPGGGQRSTGIIPALGCVCVCLCMCVCVCLECHCFTIITYIYYIHN